MGWGTTGLRPLGSERRALRGHRDTVIHVTRDAFLHKDALIHVRVALVCPPPAICARSETEHRFLAGVTLLVLNAISAPTLNMCAPLVPEANFSRQRRPDQSRRRYHILADVVHCCELSPPLLAPF